MSRRRKPLRCVAQRGVLLLLAVTLAGCGSTDAAPTGPLDGLWVGDELSFTLRGGHVEALVVHEAKCTDNGGCETTYGGEVAGRWLGVPAINITAGGYVITGQFSNGYQVSGSVVMGDDQACCRVIGAWSADRKAPLPQPGVDGGSTDGGALRGTVDWNGASLGDLHPGPSRQPGTTTGSDALSTAQQAAHVELLKVRSAVGVGGIVQDAALAQAAQAHAQFYVTHAQQYKAKGLSPHAEDAAFGDGFTGVNAGERVTKAGFTGPPGAEVMAFTGSAAGAIRGWMATVYHRLPLVAPGAVSFGYGAAVAPAGTKGGAAEVINFSARASRADDPIVVFPWPGQTGVDSAWSGNEGPQPPPPPNGYPSGPVITAHVASATAWGAHTLEDSDGNAVSHVFLDADNDPNMKTFDRHAVALYSDSPLLAGETYTVRLKLTVGGAERTLAWHFTTQ